MAGKLRSVLIIVVLAVYIRLKLVSNSSQSPASPRDMENKLQQSEIRFSFQVFGPESLAFDLQGRGPYTGVSDGRVVRWNGPNAGWSDFAFTSPNRSELCENKASSLLNLETEHICGRPLGLRFDENTGDLYIADAYYGVRVVGPEGGYAEPVATEAEGVPLSFTNDVDFGEEGLLYFTDSSLKHHKRDFVLMFLLGDETGRLLSYNRNTKVTKVILRGLQFPNGIAMSKDKSFLLICETLTCRILRYWLKGPKSGTLEVFAILPGHPDNIRLTERGDFWVAIHARPNPVLKLPLLVRRALLKSPIPFVGYYINMARKLATGMVIRYSTDGEILEVLEDQEGKVVKLVTEVNERDGRLWLGSVVLPHIAVY